MGESNKKAPAGVYWVTAFLFLVVIFELLATLQGNVSRSIFAILPLILGIGLYRLNPIARVVCLLYLVVYCFTSSYLAIGRMSILNDEGLLEAIQGSLNVEQFRLEAIAAAVIACLAAVAFVYLLRKSVKSAFVSPTESIAAQQTQIRHTEQSELK